MKGESTSSLDTSDWAFCSRYPMLFGSTSSSSLLSKVSTARQGPFLKTLQPVVMGQDSLVEESPVKVLTAREPKEARRGKENSFVPKKKDE